MPTDTREDDPNHGNLGTFTTLRYDGRSFSERDKPLRRSRQCTGEVCSLAVHRPAFGMGWRGPNRLSEPAPPLRCPAPWHLQSSPATSVPLVILVERCAFLTDGKPGRKDAGVEANEERTITGRKPSPGHALACVYGLPPLERTRQPYATLASSILASSKSAGLM